MEWMFLLLFLLPAAEGWNLQSDCSQKVQGAHGKLHKWKHPAKVIRWRCPVAKCSGGLGAFCLGFAISKRASAMFSTEKWDWTEAAEDREVEASKQRGRSGQVGEESSLP